MRRYPPAETEEQMRAFVEVAATSWMPPSVTRAEATQLRAEIAGDRWAQRGQPDDVAALVLSLSDAQTFSRRRNADLAWFGRVRDRIPASRWAALLGPHGEPTPEATFAFVKAARERLLLDDWAYDRVAHQLRKGGTDARLL